MFQLHVESRRAGFALLCIAAIISSGGILAMLIGFPKTFAFITIGLLLPWAGVGWTGFSVRTWLAGCASLVAAMAASTGEMYFVAGVCGIVAFLFLFGIYVPEGSAEKS